MKLQKIGMRTIKTGIAVTLCALAGDFIVQNPMYAGVACLVSIQDTVKGSVKLGLNRVKGTIWGGIVGFICLLIQPGNSILCGLGAILTIYGCTTLKINSAIVVSTVTFLSIQLGVITESPAIYSMHRVLDTSIGVVIGVIVNYILARPDYFERTISHVSKIEEIIEEYIKVKIIDKKDFDLKQLSVEIANLDNIYSKLKDELDYSKGTINLDNIRKQRILAKEVYYHMQSIGLLEKELYLTSKNYNLVKSMYQLDELNWEIDEDESPVFNYHLYKIIKEMEYIYKLDMEN